ncbi:hypothetical protein V8E54_015141 [Elaphomyces granulatus]
MSSRAAVVSPTDPSLRSRRACDQCKLRKTKCSVAFRGRAKHASRWALNAPFSSHRRKEVQQDSEQLQYQLRLPDRSEKDADLLNPSSSVRAAYAAEVSSSTSVSLSNSGWTSHEDMDSGLAPSIPVLSGRHYDSEISTDNPAGGAVGWNNSPDIEYWLPDSLTPDTPAFGYPGSGIYIKSSLPPIIQTDLGNGSFNIQSASPADLALHDILASQQGHERIDNIWPSYINESSLIPWIDVYFDRLHPTLPVLNRSTLFTRILLQEHRRNPQFAAMLLSLCAFALTQPIDISERPTSSSRPDQARMMMEEATKMRSCSDFGENPTLEAILTSFFLFGCLFGSNQHNAAWLRLREAVDLAVSLGLDDPQAYQNISNEESGHRMRTYLVLSITERAYALQHRHPISFRGKPGVSMRHIQNATQSVVSGIIVHNERDAAGMMGLALLMELFDAIDEDIIDCWNGRCHADKGCCQKLDESKVLAVHDHLSRVSDAKRYQSNDWFDPDDEGLRRESSITKTLSSLLRETQCADVLVTQKWLQNRVWHLCRDHRLVKIHSERPELSWDYPISLAETTMEFSQSLRISSMEAHGIGLVEKLYNIAMSIFETRSLDKDAFGNSSGLLHSPQTMLSAGLAPHATLFSHDQSVRHVAENFLKLLGTLRGGNHPYLADYKAHLNSLHIGEQEWNQ